MSQDTITLPHPTHSTRNTPSQAAASESAMEGDEALNFALRRGDRDVIAQLWEAHHSGMLRLATFLVGNRAHAEEVVQETWGALLVGFARFEGRCALKTWIYRILVKRCLTKRDRERRVAQFSALQGLEGEEALHFEPSTFEGHGSFGAAPRSWESETPDEIVENRELHDFIASAVAALSPGQRAVVTMRDLEGFDSAEVCSTLKISECNQRVLLHRGRLKLREVLAGKVDFTRDERILWS